MVTIELDKPYRLRWKTRAMVNFEKTSGIKLKGKSEDMGVTEFMMMLWAMMIDTDPNLTLDDVCRLVDDHSDIDKVIEKVLEAIDPNA